MHHHNQRIALLLGLGIALLVRPALAVTFTEIARFDVNSTATDLENPEPQDIGTHPIAVAWNGSKLYVAGYNGFGNDTTIDTAIVEITNATDTGIATPIFGTAFGQVSTPSFRAYSGLDLSGDGSTLAATHDNGEFGDNSLGIQAFDAATNTLRWSDNARGYTGPGFDPGFGGQDAGIGTANSSSGRRHLYDTTTGTQIYGPTGSAAPGLIWTTGMGGFQPHDMDFDPDNGDIYVRHNNRVTKATRDGGNSATGQTIIVDPYNDPANNNGANILGQNLSFLNNTTDGDLIIFNDRDVNTGSTADFADSVMVVDTAGVVQAANFSLLGGDSFDPGLGLYDFDFDAANQTLALLDFTNRNVHIFQIGEVAQVNGDYDDSGLVGQGDLDLVLLNWGDDAAVTGVPEGWVNMQPTGVIGQAALDGVLLNWGNGAALAAGLAANVPEPTSALLSLLGLCLWGTKRRR